MDFSFPKKIKLRSRKEIQAVFYQASKYKANKVAFFVKANQLNRPRLGIIIAKRNVKMAVDRNRIKRLIRESFRLHQHEIGYKDIVVTVYNGVNDLQSSELRACLEKLFKNLA